MRGQYAVILPETALRPWHKSPKGQPQQALSCQGMKEKIGMLCLSTTSTQLKQHRLHPVANTPGMSRKIERHALFSGCQQLRPTLADSLLPPRYADTGFTAHVDTGSAPSICISLVESCRVKAGLFFTIQGGCAQLGTSRTLALGLWACGVYMSTPSGAPQSALSL